MNDYANEHEQWDGIKTWWKENGILIIVVGLLSLGGSLGWRHWQQHQAERRGEASQLFDQLLTVQATDQTSALISRIAGELEADYTRTPYASAAALLEAKLAAEKGDLVMAAKKLQWTIDHTRDADLRTVTQIRLARVILAQKNPGAALALLSSLKDTGYTAIIDQVKGDIYLAQGLTSKARQAYQDALTHMSPSEPIKAYLEMQLYRLPA